MADVAINVIANVKDAIDGLTKIQRETKDIVDQTRRYTAVLTGLTLAKTAYGIVSSAVGRLSGYIRDAIEKARVQAAAMRQLEVECVRSGHAIGTLSRELAAFAGELQKASNYGDEAIMPMMAQLMRFGLVGDNLKRATQLALDLAAATGRDLRGAAELLGKSLGSPQEALGKLAHAGIIFTAEQKKMLDAMIQTGNTAGAQALILDVVQQKIGGTAEAMVDPTIQAQNAWGDLLELLGDPLAQVAMAIANMLVPQLQEVNNTMANTPAYADTFINALALVADAADILARAIAGLMAALYGIIELSLKAQTMAPIAPGVGVLGLIPGARPILEQMQEQYAAYRRGAWGFATKSNLWGEDFLAEFEKVQQKMRNLQPPAANVGKNLGDGFRENEGTISKILDGIQDQLETIGMSEIEKKLRELQKLGATEEEIAAARAMLEKIEAAKKAEEDMKKAQEEFNEAQREAARIAESVATPEEKARKEIEKAQDLFQRGLLSAQDYMRFLEKQKETLMPPEEVEPTGKRYAEAVTRGTGAFSAILSAISTYQEAGQRPEKKTAENTTRMVSQLEKLIEEVKRSNQEEAIEI